MSDAALDRRLHPMLQEQFDSMGQQAEASTLGMWVFLATEVLFFGGLFVAYLIYRTWFPEAFAAGSEHMDTVLGTINTAVLIFSSFTVAMAMDSGIIKSMGQVYNCPDQLLAYGHTITDTHPFGRACTVAEIMKEDSNRDIGRSQKLVEACFNSNDYHEGRKAFMEKRKPVFTGT